MTADRRSSEERALTEALASVDPVPSALSEYARAVLQWRSVDAALARLIRDTTDRHDRVGVRSGRGFVQEFEALGVALTLDFHPEERRLSGLVRPGQVAQVELFTREGTVGYTTETDGRFEFLDVPSGPTSVLCTLTDERGDEVSFKTEWRTL